jgi:Flp pilus assembly protein TadG
MNRRGRARADRRAQAYGMAQALVWFAMMLPVFLGIAGLAIDGAIVLAVRRDLQSAADGAVRAGATRVDLEMVRSSGGDTIQLDPQRARAATHAYLDERLPPTWRWGSGVERRVEVSPRRVMVTLDATVQTAFMRAFRHDTVPVSATASADVRYGIERGR